MAFGTIQLRPGVNTLATPTLNEAGISVSNLIRFRGGLVEKVGGWERYVATSMGSITRSLHAWQDLNQNKWLAAGNLSSLKAILGAAISDITPQTVTSNCAVNITTIQGSDLVTIVDTNIGILTTFDSVFFATPISVGGLILAGTYQVVNASGATTYTIRAKSPATASVLNGGAVPVFTTSINLASITVTLADHGLSDSGSFTFPISATVNGATILGSYSFLTVLDEDNFIITTTTAATGTGSGSMNSGQARYVYSVTSGPSTLRVVGGGPVGSFAIGQYAIGQGFSTSETAVAQTGTPITATDWTTDNWGEILVACPRGGNIWYWSPQSGFSTMVPIGQGPTYSNGIFVASYQQILVAWGTSTSVRNVSTDAQIDPLLIRWSDQSNFLEWSVTSRTQAGSYHIPTGSEIRGAIQGAQQAYIFTDLDCWSMQYLGPPLVFGFNQIGTGCGLVGPHAVTNLYGRTYWMGTNNFFVTTGQGVQEVACPVWDNVFQDFDKANMNKCVAAANSAFNEIWFFYPSSSGATGECDKYVKLNINGNLWDYGTLARSAWMDESVLGYPIGADPDTLLLQQHETGYDDDASPMNSFFETGDIAYGDGENFGEIDYFEPDMKWRTVSGSSSAQVQVTLTAYQAPNGSTMVSGPLTMTSTTGYLSPRLRGRQIKWRLESSDAGSWWRIGNIRYRYSLDGRR